MNMNITQNKMEKYEELSSKFASDLRRVKIVKHRLQELEEMIVNLMYTIHTNYDLLRESQDEFDDLNTSLIYIRFEAETTIISIKNCWNIRNNSSIVNQVKDSTSINFSTNNSHEFTDELSSMKHLESYQSSQWIHTTLTKTFIVKEQNKNDTKSQNNLQTQKVIQLKSDENPEKDENGLENSTTISESLVKNFFVLYHNVFNYSRSEWRNLLLIQLLFQKTSTENPERDKQTSRIIHGLVRENKQSKFGDKKAYSIPFLE